MTRQIPLTQGKVARVSDHRFEWLNRWKWCARFQRGIWYAVRNEGKFPFRKTILMHRAIMGVTDRKIQVDHRDGDGLNNQDDNLRVATNAENSRNRGKQKNNTSGFKGVSPYGKKHRAYIRVDGKTIYLGSFSTAEEAARAYDAVAKKYHGPFASLNFPLELEGSNTVRLR